MMNAQGHGRAPFLNGSTGRTILIAAQLACACLLGVALVSAGGGSGSSTLAVGAAAVIVLGGIAALTLRLPVEALIRVGFIASFFFKGDISLFKINEIEDPSGLNISLTLAAAVALMVHDHFSDERQTPVLPTAFWLLLGGLFLSAAVSVVNAGPIMLGGFSLVALLGSMIIAYAAASHFSRRDRMIDLATGIAVGLVLTGLTAISQYTLEFPTNLANFGTGTEEELLGTQSQLLSRVPAFLRTPTEMAWVVSMLIPVVLAPVVCRVKSLTSSQKALLIAGSLAGIVAVIMSLARGSWIGLGVVLAMLVTLGWLRLSRYERSRYLISTVGMAVVCAVMLVPFAPRIYDRLTQDDQGSALIRVPLMETALRMIDDNPIAGVGLSGYRSNMTRYDETGIFVSQVFANPVHNVFAHITAEVGIPGAILFVLLILFALYECSRAAAMDDRLLAALGFGLGLAMIAFVISATKEPGSLGSVRPPIRTFFLLVGAILAISRIRRHLAEAR